MIESKRIIQYCINIKPRYNFAKEGEYIPLVNELLK